MQKKKKIMHTHRHRHKDTHTHTHTYAHQNLVQVLRSTVMLKSVRTVTAKRSCAQRSSDALSKSNEILPAIIGFVHKTPLHAGGKASTPPTTKPRCCDLLQDPFVSLQKNLFCFVPLALQKKAYAYN